MIQFYFDLVSPWSFVAYQVLRKYSQTWSVPVEWCPVSLSYVMKYSGNKPPVTVANKGKYMMQEIARTRKMYNGRVSKGFCC